MSPSQRSFGRWLCLTQVVALLGVTSLVHEAAPRKLVDGVVKVVPAAPNAGDTVSGPYAMRSLLAAAAGTAWKPYSMPASETLLARAETATMHRPVWQLEFGFKPIRMLRTEIREADGSSRRVLVWYMVYYVRNPGQHLSPTPEPNAFQANEFQVKPRDHVVRFLPTFVLQAHDVKKAYLDQVLPTVVEQIRAREDPAIRFHHSVDISKVRLLPSDETERVWGVATWIDVDPRIDFFSVYVQGLTNAYRWQDLPGAAVQPGAPPDATRRIRQKTLQINFYRPGDTEHEHESEIFVGAPTNEDPALQKDMLQRYDLEAPLEYQWIYR